MSENDNAENNKKDEKKERTFTEIPPVETHHEIQLDGNTLSYTVNTGMMPLKDEESGEIEAQIFFSAYTKDNVEDRSKRPLIFVFNGGPGSASVWLHLGAVGPKRVKMQDEGWMPAPPYELIDNQQTWLDQADLVFIDPVGTGYSRAKSSDKNSKYWSLKGDLESVGEFIRLYLIRNQRWTSPLFLAGESYGTTRAAGLAGHLVDKGIAFNGILLISTVMNFTTLLFERGNDLPYMLYIPSYAATAWYHKKLASDLQERSLEDFIAEVKEWTESDYLVALNKGDRLSAEERADLTEKLARYTGLEPRFVENGDLRIEIMRFCKELLRDQNRTVGRLDSRFKGIDDLAVTEYPQFDPSLIAITPPYTAMMYQYVRGELGYETDDVYEILSFKVNEAWEFDRGTYPDTSEALRSALAKNPFMKVFVGQGYYDLATPFLAAEYTLNHMGIDADLHANIRSAEYEAGHMFYLDVTSLAKLKTDFEDFMEFALASE